MSTPSPTYTERLILVRAAIDQILTSGQNVSYSGSGSSRSLGMANLSELRKLEKEYEAAAANEIALCKGRSRLLYVTPLT